MSNRHRQAAVRSGSTVLQQIHAGPADNLLRCLSGTLLGYTCQGLAQPVAQLRLQAGVPTLAATSTNKS